MLFDSAEKVVKTGTFLYDDTVLCDVHIVYGAIRYGSGDWDQVESAAIGQQ